VKRIKTAAPALVALALAALSSLASCSSEDDNFLTRMFDLDARGRKGAPPSSIEEMREAIKTYGDELEKTVAANDKVAMYWRLLSVKYMDKKMYGPALEAARKALTFYPDNAGLYYVVGICSGYMAKTAAAEDGGGAAERERWLATAESAFLQSVELDPRNLKTLYALGVLYSFELERYEDAVSAMERYLAISTKDVDAFFLLARSLYGAGRLQEAADAYGKIMDITKLAEKRELAGENRKRIMDELYAP